MSKSKPEAKAEAVRQLARFFHRNGYLRWRNPQRLKSDGRAYKKGAEIRLVANSKQELATIRRLLKTAGFKAGRPFVKARQFRQPVYGIDQVIAFLKIIDERPRNVDAVLNRAKRAKPIRGSREGLTNRCTY